MRERMTNRKRMRLGIQPPSPYCVHVESGRTKIPKICIHGYDCRHCAFDQWIEETEERHEPMVSFNEQRDFLAKAA